MSPQATARDARQQRNSALRRAAGALLGAIVILIVALALEQEPGVGEGTQQRVITVKEVPPPPAPITAPADEEQAASAVSPLPVATPAAATLLTDVLPMADGAAARPPVVEEAVASMPSARERQPASLAVLMTQARSAPADGYRIQLGVFSDPANAIGLAQELTARGLPAGIQSRVVLGPFADRDAAHKAQAVLSAAGVEAGMLLPPLKKKR